MFASVVTSWIATLTVVCGQAIETSKEYESAQSAFQAGAVHHRAMDYKASRGPFEAALRLAKDNAYRVKVYQALLPAYREIPEFEPFQTAAEFIVTHSDQNASRSNARRTFLSFAYNRGQLNNLVKRYEERLTKNKDDFTAVYMLSELYSVTRKNPKRAIELLEQLAKLEAGKGDAGKNVDPVLSKRQAAKIAREKAKLAAQYLRAKDLVRAAELYEEIAPLDATTQAWNLKEAASARLADGDRKAALRLALAADKAPPEARNDQLTHFFHRKLGDIFLAVEQPEKAVGHFKIALEKTDNPGYQADTRKSLDEAIAKGAQP